MLHELGPEEVPDSQRQSGWDRSFARWTVGVMVVEEAGVASVNGRRVHGIVCATKAETEAQVGYAGVGPETAIGSDGAE